MKTRRRRPKRRHGGSFYAYNTTPMIFTESSTRVGGMDPRNTLIPSPLIDALRGINYNVQSFGNSFMGNYQDVNPSWLNQNLIPY